MSIAEFTTTIDGLNIHYCHAGDGGPVVVLLHGGGIDSARLSWELLIPELAQTHRVIAPDFPGYGESDKPADLPYTLEYLAAFAIEFLDALSIERCSLVGISMGGAVAMSVALDQPERVEKLVLVDSYGLQRRVPLGKLGYLSVHVPGMQRFTWAMMRSRAAIKYSLGVLLKKPGALTEELVDLAYAEAMRPGAGIAFSAFQRSEVTWNGTRSVLLDRLSEIQAPTLLVHGTKDTAVPAESSRDAQRAIAGARLAWIEGAGHWPQRDDPKAFNRVVTDFLRDQGMDG